MARQLEGDAGGVASIAGPGVVAPAIANRYSHIGSMKANARARFMEHYWTVTLDWVDESITRFTAHSILRWPGWSSGICTLPELLVYLLERRHLARLKLPTVTMYALISSTQGRPP
jgi:hypothetical protein